MAATYQKLSIRIGRRGFHGYIIFNYANIMDQALPLTVNRLPSLDVPSSTSGSLLYPLDYTLYTPQILPVIPLTFGKYTPQILPFIPLIFVNIPLRFQLLYPLSLANIIRCTPQILPFIPLCFCKHNTFAASTPQNAPLTHL